MTIVMLFNWPIVTLGYFGLGLSMAELGDNIFVRFIHLFIYSFIHLFIYSFIHLFIYSFIHLFIIHLFIHSFIHAFIHSFIYSFMHSFIHPLIHPSIHLFIPSFHQIRDSFIHSDTRLLRLSYAWYPRINFFYPFIHFSIALVVWFIYLLIYSKIW